MKEEIIVKLDATQFNELKKEVKKEALRVIDETVRASTEILGLDKEYLSSKKMAKYLGISSSTLNDYVKKGMPHVMFKNQRRFSKTSVRNWFLAHETNTKPHIQNLQEVKDSLEKGGDVDEGRD